MAEETTVSIEEFNALKEEFEQFKEQASKPQMVWVSGTYLSKNEDCYGPINAPHTMSTNEYPFVLTGPDPDMKHPKYDYAANKWIDRGEAYYEAQVQALTDDIQEVKQSVKSTDTQTQTTLDEIKKQNQGVTESISNLTQLVTQAMMTTNQAKPATDGGDK